MARGERLHADDDNTSAYPHAIIDDFFPEEVVDRALSESPSTYGLEWAEFKRPSQRKLASPREQHLSAAARNPIWEMNSQVFLQFLQRLTGIDNLIPDVQLVGGGIHQIQRGGKFSIHVDFNNPPRLRPGPPPKRAPLPLHQWAPGL